MTIDYDLVVIGSSPAGLQAAMQGAHLKARVALVEQAVSPFSPGQVEHYALLELAQQADPLTSVMPGLLEIGKLPPAPVRWHWIQQWVAAMQDTLREVRAAKMPATAGVDVIAGCGEFVRKPTLRFVVGDRTLQSRAYLLAMGTVPMIPPISGLAETGYLTVNSVLSQPPNFERLVILGGDPIAIELAQALKQLGIQVSLTVASDSLLPAADPEAAELLRAALEAAEIQVLTQSPITQVRQIQGKKWVQAGNHAIEADEILVAVGQAPDVKSLNLEAAGVHWQTDRIEVNDRLQTTNPCIYACEGRLGNGNWVHVAQYEASIALKNALFFPLSKATYRGIPWMAFTQPEVVQVGITETEASQRYGNQVVVLRRSFNHSTRAQIRSDLTGWCKLILRRNGEIVGASLVGQGASELVGAIALSIQQRLGVQALGGIAFPAPTLSEIIRETAQDWHQTQPDHSYRHNLLESFFEWRRAFKFMGDR